jgi:N6-adenosine-specific RNA methylase IME4
MAMISTPENAVLTAGHIDTDVSLENAAMAAASSMVGTSANDSLAATQSLMRAADIETGRNHAALVGLFAAHGYPRPHPLAALFRSDAEIGASISSPEDLANPVAVRKQTGEIVDGIIRCERLLAAGVPWKAVPKRWVDLPTDNDVAEFIAKCNLDRRHETQSQKAMQAVLLGIADARQGARTDLGKNCRKLLTVSSKYLQYARTVADPSNAPELAAAVLDGEINVADADKIAEFLSREQQVKIYRATRDGKHSFKTAAGNEIAAERGRLLSLNCAKFPKLVVPVGYVDAPWPEENQSVFNHRHAVAHYPVMSIEQICALPIGDVLAKDAWLFLWTTVAHRQAAVSQVIPAYGCEFVEEIIWVKNVCGVGWVVRHKHEILLIARRGNPPMPPTGSIPNSVVHADVEEHSKKPDVFRDIIVAMTPNLQPRLELFARGNPYPGFIAWGNEVAIPLKSEAA